LIVSGKRDAFIKTDDAPGIIGTIDISTGDINIGDIDLGITLMINQFPAVGNFIDEVSACRVVGINGGKEVKTRINRTISLCPADDRISSCWSPLKSAHSMSNRWVISSQRSISGGEWIS
jgi:hypothetical protein